jgi:uncharacterized protein DUF4192
VISGMLLNDVTELTAAGYGPGEQVTLVADALRGHAPGQDILIGDCLRVHDGRYWSYLCTEPSCCPPDGVPLGHTARLAASVLGAVMLQPAASLGAVAEAIGPAAGEEGESMMMATARAENTAARQVLVPPGWTR